MYFMEGQGYVKFSKTRALQYITPIMDGRKSSSSIERNRNGIKTNPVVA